jgi:hypothetical protein
MNSNMAWTWKKGEKEREDALSSRLLGDILLQHLPSWD